MDHDRARDIFTRYHDGDLSGQELSQLEQHLDECDECRAEWEGYRKTIDEVSGLFELSPSTGFTHAVEQKIRKRSRGRFFGEQRAFSIWFAVVSFILILLFILAYLVMTAATEIEFIDETTASDSPPSSPERDAEGR